MFFAIGACIISPYFAAIPKWHVLTSIAKAPSEETLYLVRHGSFELQLLETYYKGRNLRRRIVARSMCWIAADTKVLVGMLIVQAGCIVDSAAPQQRRIKCIWQEVC